MNLNFNKNMLYMKIKTSFLVLGILFLVNKPLCAQAVSTDIITGKNYSFESKILGEQRNIQVYVPESYNSTAAAYPVLYLLDGQRLFDYGVSLAKTFKKFKLTPDFIIVGISNKYPDRFSHFSAGFDSFLNFIEEEVFPLVESEYRVSEERMLFGWEYGGGFATNTLIEKNELFDAYIVASAYPLTNKLQRMDSLISSESSEEKFLYFSSASHEGVVNEEAMKLKSLLKENPSEFLDWHHESLENEEHQSTPFSTLYHGIKKYYYHYPELQFATLEEFLSFGDTEAVTDYYKKRSAQFGFPAEISGWTKFSIIRCAIRADNYSQFNRLSDEFLDERLIQGLRNNQPYTISEYYMKHKNYEKAIEIYDYLLQKDPESVKALNKLGDAFTLLQNEQEANKYYDLAKKAEQTKG